MFSGFTLFPAQASTIAPEVDNLYLGVVAITAFFAIVVVVCVTYFAIKYRDDTGERVGAPITGSMPLELGWSLIPFFIAIGIFVWASVVFFHIVRAPDQSLEVYSTGKRWMWRFQHIDGQREINELHIPIGRPVRVVFTSEDVLHDLFIPAFRVKADAVPGRYSAIWFEATQVGEYHIFCAEYCGTRHSGMIGTVYAMAPADYQAWLAGNGTTATGSLLQQGETLFTQLACVTCHLGDGTGRGPSLGGVYGAKVTLDNGSVITADESYLRESILNSQARTVKGYEHIMPTFQGLVNDDGVAALIEYIKSMQSAANQVAAAH